MKYFRVLNSEKLELVVAQIGKHLHSRLVSAIVIYCLMFTVILFRM
jgi:hypothetical protein